MKQKRINELESRNLELKNIIQESNAKALNCYKEGKKFSTTFPDEYAEFKAAEAELEKNLAEIESLREEIAAEAEEVSHEMPEEHEAPAAEE